MKTKTMKSTGIILTPLCVTANGVLCELHTIYDDYYVGRNCRYVVVDCPWHKTIESFKKGCGLFYHLDNSFFTGIAYYIFHDCKLKDYFIPVTRSLAKKLYRDI